MTAPDTKHPPAGAPEAQGPSGPQGASRPDGGADLVAMCADGVISYDPEEDW
jgi:hypothetical protein